VKFAAQADREACDQSCAAQADREACNQSFATQAHQEACEQYATQAHWEVSTLTSIAARLALNFPINGARAAV
jgi:hypothetical protein